MNNICQDCKEKTVKFFHFKRKVLNQFRSFDEMDSDSILFTPESNQASTSTSHLTEQSVEDNKKDVIKIESAISLIDPINIKEEREESPDIMFVSDFPAFTPPPGQQHRNISKPPFSNRTFTHQSWREQEVEDALLERLSQPINQRGKPLSKSALKMRIFREKLKLPENRERYLHHQQQQREYNRRHYMRKQFEEGKHKKKRFKGNTEEDYSQFILDNTL